MPIIFGNYDFLIRNEHLDNLFLIIGMIFIPTTPWLIIKIVVNII